MKNLKNFICFIAILMTSASSIIAQELSTTEDYLERHALYDYSEKQLNNTDSIPDFASKQDKLKITGTVYQSDGVTPAKDVIIYISQPDENGFYDLRKKNDKRYIHHRGWVKTDADGKYTFYTFIPGNFTRNRELKHIHPTIKEPGKEEYALEAFLFDNDPFLSKSCRKRLAKKGIDNILIVEEQNDLFVTTKDIVLEADKSEYTK
ncbi:hypothetical protein M0G43_10380 [Subsaxibacter sp. CAU 1640]|uniref:hypothetical protein n=1 Tax=Subsaxibacter sp. CAU 1640 TaxID=2933271 RepID=UPI0020067A6B|nr:hypothetical protein [Subsaxibacter sp. CAU 1640]MCK7590979.1 hypothetical protein [Subsaxibacter sp. CAU 1640]